MSESKVSAQLQTHSASEPRAVSRPRRPLRIALFGFGTVGSSVARILVESRPEGIELTHIYSRSLERRRVDWVPSSVAWTDDADAVLASSDVDVVRAEVFIGAVLFVIANLVTDLLYAWLDPRVRLE